LLLVVVFNLTQVYQVQIIQVRIDWIAGEDVVLVWKVIADNDPLVSVVVKLINETKPVDDHTRSVAIPVAPQLFLEVRSVMFFVSKECLGLYRERLIKTATDFG
jgi:hypothetical protein